MAGGFNLKNLGSKNWTTFFKKTGSEKILPITVTINGQDLNSSIQNLPEDTKSVDLFLQEVKFCDADGNDMYIIILASDPYPPLT